MTIKLDWMRGCATALVTPFKKDGSIDDECFRKLVERQVKNGVKILIPCGTTGRLEERIQNGVRQKATAQ